MKDLCEFVLSHFQQRIIVLSFTIFKINHNKPYSLYTKLNVQLIICTTCHINGTTCIYTYRFSCPMNSFYTLGIFCRFAKFMAINPKIYYTFTQHIMCSIDWYIHSFIYFYLFILSFPIQMLPDFPHSNAEMLCSKVWGSKDVLFLVNNRYKLS